MYYFFDVCLLSGDEQSTMTCSSYVCVRIGLNKVINTQTWLPLKYDYNCEEASLPDVTVEIATLFSGRSMNRYQIYDGENTYTDIWKDTEVQELILQNYLGLVLYECYVKSFKLVLHAFSHGTGALYYVVLPVSLNIICVFVFPYISNEFAGHVMNKNKKEQRTNESVAVLAPITFFTSLEKQCLTLPYIPTNWQENCLLLRGDR